MVKEKREITSEWGLADTRGRMRGREWGVVEFVPHFNKTPTSAECWSLM